ncbi:MAG: copper homeostasis protein CutC [Ginsengibacter sp.]
MKLEIIGFNIESCRAAQEAGADRIELCANPAEGGTTPSHGFIKKAREILSIELYIMIRPRGGNFIYSGNELEIMNEEILICKQLGCDGIVLGILTREGTVDKNNCSKLINYAYPLGVTFHRAFDRTADPMQSLEDIIDIGCERILTSGHQPKAMDGLDEIKALVQQADDRIIIMPGSGINSENITNMAKQSGATEFHSSASVMKKTTGVYNNVSLQENAEHVIVNKHEVAAMRKVADELQLRS